MCRTGLGLSLVFLVFPPEFARGVQYHHKDGYNLAYVDGHSEYFKDLQHEVQQFGGGPTYHVDHTRQDYVWKKFFDKVTKYKPRQEY